MRARDQLSFDLLAQTESLFALSNGHIGVRGNLDEGEPHGLPGTYLNGVYELRPLPYAESSYGQPESGQTMIDVTNGKIIRLLVGDEPFDLRYGTLRHHERVLDLRAGTLRRIVEWESPAHRTIRVTSTRFVSFSHRAILAIGMLGGNANVLGNIYTQEKDPTNQAAALVALGLSGGDVTYIANAYTHNDNPQVRSAALMAIGLAGGNTRYLANQYETETDMQVRSAALVALGIAGANPDYLTWSYDHCGDPTLQTAALIGLGLMGANKQLVVVVSKAMALGLIPDTFGSLVLGSSPEAFARLARSTPQHVLPTPPWAGRRPADPPSPGADGSLDALIGPKH